jgi:hypothetical protein
MEKTSKFFSFNERGRVKHKFCCRRIVSDIISGLIQQDNTANYAINIIYNVYGQQKKITNIINGLKRDVKSDSLNPNLRIKEHEVTA